MIGIDLCPSTCRVMVKETVAGERRFHHVSDGVRRSIPFRADTGGAWGSAAAAEPDPTTPSLDRSAFFRGLRQRILHHLGGLGSDVLDAYDVTVACEDAGDGACGEVERALRAVKFSDSCRVVAPVDAVLVAWLQTRPARLQPGTIVAAVCCGETLTQVRAYRLEPRRAAPTSDIVGLPDCGHAQWRDHLRASLAARYREPPPVTLMAAIDDSIVEMARALSRAAPTDELAWRGAAAGRLFEPLVLSPIETGTWPGVAALREGLPEALHRAAAALGAPRPAAVALGGIGSVWPFAREVLVASGLEPWQAKDPLDTVAIGAAAWSDGGPVLASLPAGRARRALAGSE